MSEFQFDRKKLDPLKFHKVLESFGELLIRANSWDGDEQNLLSEKLFEQKGKLVEFFGELQSNIIKCGYCAKIFFRRNENQRYCSQQCYHRWRSATAKK